MKPKITFFKTICGHYFANLQFKKTAFLLLLLCGLTFASKGQSHEDSVVVLARNTFTVVVNHTLDGLLHFELVNNQASEITPFFMETYIKGYNLNETHIEQSLNNILFTENIERIFGPQFMGLGISTLPAFGNYKTTFETTGKTNETSSIQIRISGTMNGQPVTWSKSFNF